ncbi:ribonuclease H-like domain-containing protein [Rhizophagus clarus]|uniref:Ribonuclease H-like domain-containing protein n=1 Tax=Rhizophagus clarus TaxID=94130 RepID=A0A8H3L1S1_9GLOM|nr:ribonuclease H-like domain-containing protein [Rhizophagus clarus]
MTISNGWAFQWVENQVTIEFFNFISPLLQLPSRKTLADEILKNTAKNVQNNIEIAAKEDKYDGQVLIWGAKDISGDRENTDAAVKHISAFLNETQAKNIKINTVITDSASKQLRRIHDDIVFLSCFAHQANLCVADVLKSSPKLLKASKNATAIVKYFNASSKFTKDLRDEQKRIYNKYIMLIKPAGRNDLSDVTVIQGEEGNNECNDENYKEMMSSRLERRWKTWEQPLLILSFFLHPSYKLQFFASDPKLSYINLNKWVQYYYIKWFGKNPTTMV